MDITVSKYKKTGNRIEATFSDGSSAEGRYDSFVKQYMMEFSLDSLCQDITDDLFAGYGLKREENNGSCMRVIYVTDVLWLDKADADSILRTYVEEMKNKLMVLAQFPEHHRMKFIVTSGEVV